ncbi:endopeptidase La, partial [Oscillospiraceae bacterium OttesenSCG-928-F05]|nr:endopeptidase La [Oscillospiraceae bacterium OttesenSCG-928-F05]
MKNQSLRLDMKPHSTMPLLALRGLVVFPEMVLHFDVGREKSIAALNHAMADDQLVFLTAQRDIRTDEPDISEVYTCGTVSRICQILKLPGGSVRVLVEGIYRAKLLNAIDGDAFYTVEVEQMDIPKKRKSKRLEALVREAQTVFDEYAGLAPRMTHEVVLNVMASDDPAYLADYIAQNIPVQHQDKQVFLEERDPVRRLEKICTLLSREIEIMEIGANIQGKVRDQLSKNQRDYFLREQLKAIQYELGDRDDTAAEADDYKEKIQALGLETEWEEKLLKEAARLSRMSSSSPESGVIRTYLDTCLDLPWKKTTKDRLNLKTVQRSLDRDHYGLEKVKDRIIEYMAVKQLAPDMKGQILCLVGPPGVGKTSVAMSLAGAMNRKLARLSLGGVRDEAEIRGHRKTYIGAMPGRIINAVRQAGSRNALLLLDEIDKLGSDYRGDPSAALLEVLDAEQNHAFRDHYIEIPFDLSDVMFVTTANTLDTIPRPLLDRMEVIELTSYTDEEKLHIAKNHLLPKQIKKHGLSRQTLRVSDGALREIIAGYTRESGVRRLEREIAKLCRKVAREIASGEAASVRVASDKLETYMGIRKYRSEKRRQTGETGVACGLAWTQVGGEILEVEVGVMEGSGQLELTGNLGKVMKESARAAITYIRGRAEVLGIDPKFHKEKDMHIHFPEGAVPKDGPSAGITMATAMVSALSGAPVRSDLAMTGEITLRGRVLPIGGLKEKTMAAYRNGIQTVIIPSDNEKDLE